MIDVIDWIDEHSQDETVWYVKRLSGNDTLANGSHQAGPYLPKPVFFRLFPALKTHTADNADCWFDLYVDSHPDAKRARVVWYNNKLRGGTRDEVRITNLGGGASALLDPESIGALTSFAFRLDADGQVASCNVWVCRNDLEEEQIEQLTGAVDPGRWLLWPNDGDLIRLMEAPRRADCRLSASELPPGWLTAFPSGREIIHKVIELRPDHRLNVDDRLMRRRDCEFELFKAIEEAIELPRAKAGFGTITDFLEAAQTVLQRRKARSGKSLEYHFREILLEESFREGSDFTFQPKAGNSPDFLFPSETAYLDPSFPRDRLRMLAVKTTFRDRWRQVAEECQGLPEKHMLTLQEGVSDAQYRLIRGAGIRLVVPAGRIAAFAKDIRPEILSLERFLAELRAAGP